VFVSLSVNLYPALVNADAICAVVTAPVFPATLDTGKETLGVTATSNELVPSPTVNLLVPPVN
jgi:hypothetical protein